MLHSIKTIAISRLYSLSQKHESCATRLQLVWKSDFFHKRISTNMLAPGILGKRHAAAAKDMRQADVLKEDGQLSSALSFFMP